MIRINLLPIRAARKRESVQQQLAIGAFLLLGALGGFFYLNHLEASKTETLQRDIKATKQQIEQYKKAIGEVEKYKGLEETLNRKLKIIENLIKGKTGPVRVLDRLSQVIPKQVWLTGWTEKGGRVLLEGEALSNKYVANFVSALKESLDGTPKPAALEGAAGTGADAAKPAEKEKPGKNFFSNIRLVDVEAIVDKVVGRNFVKFQVSMNVNYSI